jgi:phosphate transport system permease protein
MAMNMNHALYRRRRLANAWGMVTSMLAMALGLSVLLWILVVLMNQLKRILILYLVLT